MKEIDVVGTTYKIPESWNDITLHQQMVVERLMIEHPEYRSMAMLSGYLDMEMEQVKKLHINTVKKLIAVLDFLNQPLPADPVHEFEHLGFKYFVIPSMLKGEFQDFISFEAAREQYKDKPFHGLPLMIAILCKREDESLDDYDIEERAKEFVELPLPIANGLNTFFLTSANLLNPDYNSVLEMQNQNILQSTDYMLTMLKDSRGGGLLTRCLRDLLRIYLRCLKRIWRRHYYGYRSGTQRMTLTQRFKKYFQKKVISN